MKLLTVAHLRKLIEHLPDDTRVLRPASDHSYKPAEGMVGTALLESEGNHWTEDYGEEMTPEADYGKRHKVLIVS